MYESYTMYVHVCTPYTYVHVRMYLFYQYAALDPSGCNIAVAGKAGFALYSGVRKKWKLFGNEVQVSIIFLKCR